MEMNLDAFKELENNDMSQINAGGPVAAALGVGGMFASGPVGIGIGLFCGSYGVTRAICS